MTIIFCWILWLWPCDLSVFFLFFPPQITKTPSLKSTTTWLTLTCFPMKGQGVNWEKQQPEWLIRRGALSHERQTHSNSWFFFKPWKTLADRVVPACFGPSHRFKHFCFTYLNRTKAKKIQFAIGGVETLSNTNLEKSAKRMGLERQRQKELPVFLSPPSDWPR